MVAAISIAMTAVNAIVLLRMLTVSLVSIVSYYEILDVLCTFRCSNKIVIHNEHFRN